MLGGGPTARPPTPGCVRHTAAYLPGCFTATCLYSATVLRNDHAGSECGSQARLAIQQHRRALGICGILSVMGDDAKHDQSQQPDAEPSHATEPSEAQRPRRPIVIPHDYDFVLRYEVPRRIRPFRPQHKKEEDDETTTENENEKDS
jgi:hypothetical protein